MFSAIASVAKHGSVAANYIFKPHPAFPYDPCPKHISNLGLQISNEPLSTLFHHVDVVFASAVTSASVDAHSAGLCVIQLMDGNQPNTSPLRGLQGATQVRSDNELVFAFQSCANERHEKSVQYFLLDENLKEWVNLLGL